MSFSITQDYIKESDNLVSLHDQIRDCDIILSQMESLLSGFQVAYYIFVQFLFSFYNFYQKGLILIKARSWEFLL